MIPIFRAKKIDSNEYVEGFYIPYNDKKCYIGHRDIVCISNRLVSEDKIDVRAIKCDMTTLSIHFSNMIDVKGNKIFASLSENTKGGDILIEEGRYKDGFNPIFEPYFRKSSLSIFDLPNTPCGEYQLKYYKIIGIQQ